MTINSNPSTNEQQPQQPEQQQHAGHKRPLARSLTRSWSTVTIFASEPSLEWHKPPAIHLHPHTSLALGGLAGAAMAAAAVSPVVTVVDLGIVRAQMDARTGGSLFRAVRHTLTDLWAGRLAWGRPLHLVSTVYFGTYLVANQTQIACTNAGVDHRAPTVAAAAAFNIAAIAYKDHHFYRLFNNGAAKPFPLPSYGLMAMRDGLTITSSFLFKQQLQEHLEQAHGVKHAHADLAASFAVPLAAQFLSTPLHIVAMDLSKRPAASAWCRAAAVASGFSSVLTGRVMRILPAFSLGSFTNDMVKEAFFEYNGVPYEK